MLYKTAISHRNSILYTLEFSKKKNCTKTTNMPHISITYFKGSWADIVLLSTDFFVDFFGSVIVWPIMRLWPYKGFFTITVKWNSVNKHTNYFMCLLFWMTLDVFVKAYAKINDFYNFFFSFVFPSFLFFLHTQVKGQCK